jgi:hypothetical protein
MSEKRTGLAGFFDKIRQEEDAVKIVRAGSLVFLAAGLFFAVASVWSGVEFWVHGLAYIVLGFLLRQFRSRVIASLLFLLAVTTLLQQFRLFPDHTYSAGASIIVAAVLVFVCVRAIEATFRLRAKAAAKAPVGDG